MEKFGIFNSRLGERKDFPWILIDKAFTQETENVHLLDGTIRRVKNRKPELLNGAAEAQAVPDSNPVMRYDWITLAGNGYLLAYTKAHVYKWNSSSKAWDLLWTCAGDVAGWSTDALGDKLIATNNIDHVLVWDDLDGGLTSLTPIGVTFKDETGSLTATNGSPTLTGNGTSWTGTLAGDDSIMIDDGVLYTISSVDNDTQLTLSENYGGATAAGKSYKAYSADNGILIATDSYLTAAKAVRVYENYVHLGNTTEDGAVCPRRDRWSGNANHTNFNVDDSSVDAGSFDLDGKAEITGYALYDIDLIIFRKKWISRMWLGGEFTFTTVNFNDKVGTVSPDSIVKDKEGRLYFYADDGTFREIRGGSVSQPIKPDAKAIAPSLRSGIRGAYIDEYDEIWWAVPKTVSSTENDLVLVYRNGRWTRRNIAVSAFGTMERTTITYIDDLQDNIDDQGMMIDSPARGAGIAIDICGDYSGYTFASHESELDGGSSFTGSFVLTTDLMDKQGLGLRKTILESDWYFKPEDNTTITVEVQAGGDGSWRQAGTITLDGVGKMARPYLALDYTAEIFDIRLTADGPFTFMGVIFKYEDDGEP